MSDLNPTTSKKSRAEQWDEKYDKEMNEFFEKMLLGLFIFTCLSQVLTAFLVKDSIKIAHFNISMLLTYIGYNLITSIQSKKRIALLETRVEQLERPISDDKKND